MRRRPSEGQPAIDFDRASKLRIIERAELTIDPGRRTSPASCKAVLRAIDSHARDNRSAVLKIETLALEAGLSRPATFRAVAELERQCLVNVARRRHRGKRASEYAIIWSNLRGQVDDPPAARHTTVDGVAVEYASQWSRVLRPPSRADKSNLGKIAVLVASGQIPEADVATVLNEIRRADREPVRRPMAYFMDSLRKRVERQAIDLQELMRSVHLDRPATVRTG